jgi:DNA-binding CsgD family transcriptional regulator
MPEIVGSVNVHQVRPGTPRYPPGAAAFGLTPRDIDLLRLIADGENISVIAGRLCYSESTIKMALRYMFRKLGAVNRTHAVAIALRAKVI